MSAQSLKDLSGDQTAGESVRNALIKALGYCLVTVGVGFGLPAIWAASPTMLEVLASNWIWVIGPAPILAVIAMTRQSYYLRGTLDGDCAGARAWLVAALAGLGLAVCIVGCRSAGAGSPYAGVPVDARAMLAVLGGATVYINGFALGKSLLD